MARSRKLGYGEGSVYWDESVQLWRGAVTIDGRRHRVSGLTKSEATEALGQLRDTVNAGKPADDPTLGQWVEWWLEHVGAPKEGSGESTRENYRWALAQTAPIWGVKLSELRAADVNRLLGSLAKRKATKPSSRGGRRGPLGESALRRVRFALSAVLDAAIADGRLVVNVANPKLARIPSGARQIRPRRSLTFDEATGLMDAAEGHRLEALVAVMLWCGLRPGEVTGLTWDCIDFKNETMTVRQSRKVGIDGAMDLGETKAKSDRTFRIPDLPSAPVLRLLAAHQTQQKKDRLAAPVWEYEDLVFTNAIGDYIDPSNLRREIAGLCENAGIFPAITPNELRHSCTSLLRELGVHDSHIAALLGHRDTRMIDKHYGHRVVDVVDLTEAQGRMLNG
jgi:integrase